MNKCNGDEIKPYLDTIENLIYLEDDIEIERYEWILGVPILKYEKSFNTN